MISVIAALSLRFDAVRAYLKAAQLSSKLYSCGDNVCPYTLHWFLLLQPIVDRESASTNLLLARAAEENKRLPQLTKRRIKIQFF
jgi:hypothetical protein